jgi:glycosyltransferase involved in cell wall biosynthesis
MTFGEVRSLEAELDCDVSVILTVHNQSATLPLILRLLGEQDYPGKWELIIADDGSSPATLDYIPSESLHLNVDLKYVWHSRKGERRAATRNNGLRVSRGRVVLLLDGDMAVAPDFISRHAAWHSRDSILVYGSRSSLFLGDLDRIPSLEDVVYPLLADSSHSDLNELAFQEKYAESASPWAACMSCNMSFTNTEVMFDEAFVGWGAEDQEFACRLATRHGYKLHFDASLVGLHLDPGKRTDARPTRPDSSFDIEQYVRNVFHFYKSYPDIDTSAACGGLGYYSLNDTTKRWERAQAPTFSRAHVKSLLDRAEEWLQRTQSLPRRE